MKTLDWDPWASKFKLHQIGINWRQNAFLSPRMHHTCVVISHLPNILLLSTVGSFDQMKPHISSSLTFLFKGTSEVHQHPQRYISKPKNEEDLALPPKLKCPYLGPHWSPLQNHCTCSFPDACPCEWSQPDWVEPRISTTSFFEYTQAGRPFWDIATATVNF